MILITKQRQILKLLKELPRANQVEIANQILGEVHPSVLEKPSVPKDFTPSPEYIAELDRRFDAYISGEEPGYPIEQVFEKIKQRLG